MVPDPLTAAVSTLVQYNSHLPDPDIDAFTSLALRSEALILPDPEMPYSALAALPAITFALPDPKTLEEKVLTCTLSNTAVPDPAISSSNLSPAVVPCTDTGDDPDIE